MWEKAELDQLYDAIYHRKSVRRMEPTLLGVEKLEEILLQTKQLTALDPEARVAFRILSESQVKGRGPAQCPYHLAVYAENSPEAHTNAAFMLQQMDLWLSAQGLGTVWVGMLRARPEVATAEGLPFVFLLAFGTPAEKPHRESVSEFRRKPLSAITDLQGMERMLEPVRLAPSALAREPWFLTGSAQAIRVCGKRDGVLIGALTKNLMYIDIGIALCHLWLAAEKENRFAGFARETGQTDAPKGYVYIWTVRVKDA